MTTAAEPSICPLHVEQNVKSFEDKPSLPSNLLMWDFLPDEIIIKIFENLQVVEVGSCNRVSRRWNQLSNDEKVWASIFKKSFPISKMEEKTSVKEQFKNLAQNGILSHIMDNVCARSCLNQVENAICFRALNNGQILFGKKHGRLEVWDCLARKQIFRIQTRQYDLMALELNRNQDTVISGGFDGSIKIIDLKRKLVREFFRSKELLSVTRCLTLSNDQKKLASAYTIGKVILFNMENEQIEQQFQISERDTIRSMTFFDQDQKILIGHRNAQHTIIDLKSGTFNPYLEILDTYEKPDLLSVRELKQNLFLFIYSSGACALTKREYSGFVVIKEFHLNNLKYVSDTHPDTKIMISREDELFGEQVDFRRVSFEKNGKCILINCEKKIEILDFSF